MRDIIKEILDNQLRQFRRNCPLDITDLVFLEIENHYLDRYEKAINYKGQDAINKYIGKFIREYWDLQNLGRCNSPKSRLITSYEKHSN